MKINIDEQRAVSTLEIEIKQLYSEIHYLNETLRKLIAIKESNLSEDRKDENKKS